MPIPKGLIHRDVFAKCLGTFVTLLSLDWLGISNQTVIESLTVVGTSGSHLIQSPSSCRNTWTYLPMMIYRGLLKISKEETPQPACNQIQQDIMAQQAPCCHSVSAWCSQMCSLIPRLQMVTGPGWFPLSALGNEGWCAHRARQDEDLVFKYSAWER